MSSTRHIIPRSALTFAAAALSACAQIAAAQTSQCSELALKYGRVVSVCQEGASVRIAGAGAAALHNDPAVLGAVARTLDPRAIPPATLPKEVQGAQISACTVQRAHSQPGEHLKIQCALTLEITTAVQDPQVLPQ